MKYKVGQKVKVIYCSMKTDDILLGMTGVICNIYDDEFCYGVDFGEETGSENACDCHGHCKYDEGEYFREDEIELVYKNPIIKHLLK